MWWYDGGELPPEDLRALVGTRMPEQGSLVVGTDGLLVLPHGGDAFALPDAKMATIQKPELTPRDHYGEFLDAVLAGARHDLLGRLRLQRPADRVGADRQRRRALPRRERSPSTRPGSPSRESPRPTST